jgi:LysM repeat protein
MTEIADPEPVSGLPSTERRSAHAASDAISPIHDICPLLLADDGAWRSAAPAREHRCAALGPEVVLGPDKQRRLCLTATHRSCATYSTAMRLERPAGDPVTRHEPAVRPYPRMAPVVLDRRRLGTTVSVGGGGRLSGQLVLAGLMAVAFGAIAITRLPGAGDDPGLVAGATSPMVTARPTVAPTVLPTVSPAATVAPTAAPATPVPSPVRTYTVRRGDTLSGIAAEFGTTVKALAELNDIEDPARIRIGAVLELP